MKNITREEALELWLTTLEQYPERQTDGYLKRANGQMCCLGQLCDLLYDENEIKLSDSGEYYLYCDEYSYEVLPMEIVEFMGFIDVFGGLKNGDPNFFSSLADMNDLSTSWPEIAKFIRENPDKVFKI